MNVYRYEFDHDHLSAGGRVVEGRKRVLVVLVVLVVRQFDVTEGNSVPPVGDWFDGGKNGP